MPKLRLKVTHTHAGVAYPPGHVLDVDEHSARWLTERAIATLANGDVQPVSETPAARPARSHTTAPNPKE